MHLCACAWCVACLDASNSKHTIIEQLLRDISHMMHVCVCTCLYDYHIVASIKTLATFESVCAWVVCKHSHITIIQKLLRGVPHIREAHTELIGRLIDVRAHVCRWCACVRAYTSEHACMCKYSFTHYHHQAASQGRSTYQWGAHGTDRATDWCARTWPPWVAARSSRALLRSHAYLDASKKEGYLA